MFTNHWDQSSRMETGCLNEYSTDASTYVSWNVQSDSVLMVQNVSGGTRDYNKQFMYRRPRS